MKTLKQFTKWWNKTGAESKTQNLDYSPGKDFMKRVREREAAEKKRKEKWSKELTQKMNSGNYTYSSTIGHLPSSTITSGSITTTSLADAKIRIDGGENGSMRVDVPLLVDGRDVLKELDEMRDALLLLKRDVDMEAKYPRLKEIKDEYEAQLEKYKTWEALK